MLKPGDIVIQHANDGVWFMTDRGGETHFSPSLVGLCIRQDNSRLHEIGDESPFSIEPLDDDVEIVGNITDYDVAVAAAALGAFDG